MILVIAYYYIVVVVYILSNYLLKRTKQIAVEFDVDVGRSMISAYALHYFNTHVKGVKNTTLNTNRDSSVKLMQIPRIVSHSLEIAEWIFSGVKPSAGAGDLDTICSGFIYEATD